MLFASKMMMVGGAANREAKALFDRMTTTPSAARQQLIIDTIKALKDGPYWNALDLFYMTAAHNEQAALLNWKSDSYDLTKSGTLTFTADSGFTTSFSGRYLTSSYGLSSKTYDNQMAFSAHRVTTTSAVPMLQVRGRSSSSSSAVIINEHRNIDLANWSLESALSANREAVSSPINTEQYRFTGGRNSPSLFRYHQSGSLITIAYKDAVNASGVTGADEFRLYASSLICRGGGAGRGIGVGETQIVRLRAIIASYLAGVGVTL